VGVIHVGSRRRRRFTENDLALLQLVADRAATFMERLRLQQAEREAHKEAEAARTRSAFLAEASRVLNSSQDYRTTLSNVARQVVPGLATWCVVDVLETDGTLQRLEIAESDPKRQCCLYQDKGIGIPSGDLSRIFERFKRGSNVSEAVPGSGIGLAGVKQIVEQHGGSIEVESREGEGSTFTVRLPLSSAKSLSAAAAG
jgi:K+-sensing histidine kinase KdpD